LSRNTSSSPSLSPSLNHGPPVSESAKIDVLLVEDDLVDQLAVKRAVEKKGLPYRLKVASTVAEAIAILAAGRFDALVTDYHLPDGTGFDVAAVRRGIPWIIMTGGGDEGVAVAALRQGAHDYLVKADDQSHLEILPFAIDAATRLQRAEARSGMLSLAMTGIMDAVYITDPAGMITFANAAFDRLYRYGDGSNVGRDDRDLWSINIVRRSNEGAGAGGEWSGEALHVRGDGSEFPVWLSQSTLLDGAGRALARVWVVRDMTERRRVSDTLTNANQALERSQQSLQELASRDDMTGLINRRELTRLFEEEVSRARRVARPMSLLLIDIDHFKRVNDDYGHGAGDEVIRYLAGLLRRTLRLVDRAARIGGEEFAILLPETDCEDAIMVAERLRQLVARAPCAIVDRHGTARDVGFTISIGVASASQPPGSLTEVLARADRGLYRAKLDGRNRVASTDDAAVEAPAERSRDLG
jgi:diguanylate cyclase (GGDEF)-like protein/PAS domain S-box-containing protein